MLQFIQISTKGCIFRGSFVAIKKSGAHLLQLKLLGGKTAVIKGSYVVIKQLLGHICCNYLVHTNAGGIFDAVKHPYGKNKTVSGVFVATRGEIVAINLNSWVY